MKAGVVLWTIALAAAAAAPARAETEDDRRLRIARERVAREQARVEALLGTHVPSAIPVELGSAAAHQTAAAAVVDPTLAARERAWHHLGLLKPTDNLVSATNNLHGKAAAFFRFDAADPAHAPIVLWDPKTAPGNIAHEMTHAIRYRQFDLGREPVADAVNHDRWLAAKAIPEGEAVLIQHRLENKNVPSSGSLIGAASLPKILSAEKELIYISGAHYLAATAAGKSAAVNHAAYANPPRSTEAIIDPRKRDDPPKEVRLPDVSALLGDRVPVYTNTIGALGVKVLMGETAARGWGGDKIVYAERKDGRDPLTIWMTTWDSAKDAREFQRSCEKKFKADAVVHLGGDGTDVVVIKGGDQQRADQQAPAILSGFSKRDATPVGYERRKDTIAFDPPSGGGRDPGAAANRDLSSSTLAPRSAFDPRGGIELRVDVRPEDFGPARR